MITEFTTPFVESKKQFIEWVKTQDGDYWYPDLLKKAVELINDARDFGYGQRMDSGGIHKIDDGDYQGTLLFVIRGTGYQPSDYWYTFGGYGSCSGCDALEDARGYGSEEGNYEAIYNITLNLVQGLKKMGDE